MERQCCRTCLQLRCLRRRLQARQAGTCFHSFCLGCTFTDVYHGVPAENPMLTSCSCVSVATYGSLDVLQQKWYWPPWPRQKALMPLQKMWKACKQGTQRVTDLLQGHHTPEASFHHHWCLLVCTSLSAEPKIVQRVAYLELVIMLPYIPCCLL